MAYHINFNTHPFSYSASKSTSHFAPYVASCFAPCSTPYTSSCFASSSAPYTSSCFASCSMPHIASRLAPYSASLHNPATLSQSYFSTRTGGHGPDFHNIGSIMHDPPEKEPLQFHFRKRNSSLLEKAGKFLFLFYVSSFAGWFWEVLLYAFKEGRFVNRGFFYGPWLPIYGIGSIALLFFLGHIRKHPVWVFLLSALGGGSLEFGVGWFLHHFYNLRYWDYRGIPFNLLGYTCLYFVLVFGALGTFWVCFLSHKITGAWNQLTANARRIILGILTLCFAADCIISLIWPNTGQGITF